MGSRSVTLAIFLAAAALRLWGVAEPQHFIWDEAAHIPSSDDFVRNGLFYPLAWHHPPLNAHLTFLSMQLFGNNPCGWRMAHAVLGSLSVLVLMLFAGRMFADRRIAWLAGIFLATEPLHVALSRTNFGEIPSIFFFLLFLYAVARHLSGDERALLWAGVPLGLSLAGKWYFLLPAAAVGGFLVVMIPPEVRGRRRVLRAAYVVSGFLVAAGVYLLTFYPWFRRGGSIPDFLRWQYDAYRSLQAVDGNYFIASVLKSSLVEPWQWFTKPLITGRLVRAEGAWSSFDIVMNNPPVWLLVIPASAYLLIRLRAHRAPGVALSLILFAAAYLQFILVERPVFLYSALPALPFAYLLIASAAAEVSGGSPRGRMLFAVLAAGAVLWGLYIYPLVTGRMVPAVLYDFLLPG